jgi:hypothetical protein
MMVDFVIILQCLAFIVLSAVCLIITILNWSIIVTYLKDRRSNPDARASSWIPLIGGVAGSVAFAISPVLDGGLRPYFWVPLLTDWGCLPGFIHAAVFILLMRRRPGA